MKKKPKVSNWHDNVYGTHFWLVVGGTWQEAEHRFYKENNEKFEKSDDEGATSYGMLFYHEKTKNCCIWLKDWKNNHDYICTLVHECMHAANRVLNSTGVPVQSAGNDEPYTYYTGWILRNCLWELKKK